MEIDLSAVECLRLCVCVGVCVCMCVVCVCVCVWVWCVCVCVCVCVSSVSSQKDMVFTHRVTTACNSNNDMMIACYTAI